MPRVAVLPDADHLRDGIHAPVLYLEELSPEDLDDEHVAMQFLERLEYALNEQLFGEVGG